MGGRREVTSAPQPVADSGVSVITSTFSAQNGIMASRRREGRSSLNKETPRQGVFAGESAGLVDDQGQPEQERPEDEVQDPGAEGQGG
jgi:hypothetical protein